MSKSSKLTWLVPPSYDYSPDGPIALGSIFPSATSIDRSLNSASRVPIDPSTIKQTVSSKVIHLAEEPKRLDRWRKILNLISKDHEKSENVRRHVLEYDHLISSIFRPTTEYITQSIESPNVQSYLKSSHREKRLYMVTGVQIARGANMRKESWKGGSVSVPAILTTGAPSTVLDELAATIETSVHESTSFYSASDFVYAFRLQEIIIKKFSASKSSALSSVSSTTRIDLSLQLPFWTFEKHWERSTPNISSEEQQRPKASSKIYPQEDIVTKSPPLDNQDENIHRPGINTKPISDSPFVLRDVSAENFGLKSLFTEDISETVNEPQTKEFEETISSYARFDLRRQSLDSGYWSSAETELTTWDEYELEQKQLGSLPLTAVSPLSLPRKPPTVPYYYGLRGGLELVASSMSDSDNRSRRNAIDLAFPAKKHFFPLGKHNIVDRWRSEIIPKIQRLNNTGVWTSFHCLRIGFEAIAEENPVVVLIVVQAGMIGKENGAKLRDQVLLIVQGLGVEVEIAEMAQPRATLGGNFHELHGPFDEKPYLGASISPPPIPETEEQYVGSFGGYLSAKSEDGEQILLTMTCDHVCFDELRPCKEWTTGSAFNAKLQSNTTYFMETPCKADYAAKIQSLDKIKRDRQVDLEQLNELPAEEKNISEEKDNQRAIEKVNEEISEIDKSEKSLGFVYGAGGKDRIDEVSKIPMDWGVIRALPNDIVCKSPTGLNKLPPIVFEDQRNTLTAIGEKLAQTNRDNLRLQFNIYSASLPSQISSRRSEPLSSDDVYYKVGRTTHWTAGVYNTCSSVVYINNTTGKENIAYEFGDIEDDIDLHPHDYGNYMSCEVACFLGVQPARPFGAGGDSGSLVFDCNGKAVGLYCAGGPVGCWAATPLDISCVIDINTIFADIEKQLGLTKLKFANGE